MKQRSIISLLVALCCGTLVPATATAQASGGEDAILFGGTVEGPECSSVQRSIGTVTVYPAKDLGQGFVLQETLTAGDAFSDHIGLIAYQCNSSEDLQLTTLSEYVRTFYYEDTIIDESYPENIHIARGKVYQLVSEARQKGFWDGAIVLDQFVMQIEIPFGITSKMTSEYSAEKSCVCKLYYPDSAGAKL